MAETIVFKKVLTGMMMVLRRSLSKSKLESDLCRATEKEVEDFHGILQSLKSRSEGISIEFDSACDSLYTATTGDVEHEPQESSMPANGRDEWLSAFFKMILVMLRGTAIETIQIEINDIKRPSEIIKLGSSSCSFHANESEETIFQSLKEQKMLDTLFCPEKNAFDTCCGLLTIYISATGKPEVPTLEDFVIATGMLYQFGKSLREWSRQLRNAILEVEGDGIVLRGSKNDASSIRVRYNWPNLFQMISMLEEQRSHSTDVEVALEYTSANETEELDENCESPKAQNTDSEIFKAAQNSDKENSHQKEDDRDSKETKSQSEIHPAVSASLALSPHLPNGLQSDTKSEQVKPNSRLGKTGLEYEPHPVESSQTSRSQNEPYSDERETAQVKNVFLLGLTGEGKSTLANAITKSEQFAVSHASTGTREVSNALVETDEKVSIMVWDTPGMNDERGSDNYFHKELGRVITRTQTAAAIVYVCKQGGRVPASLKETTIRYRKSLGESLMSCLCVCVGMNATIEEKATLEAITQYWRHELYSTLGYNLPEERIFFFDARNTDGQPEFKRFEKWIANASVRRLGVGNTVFEGLRQVRNGTAVQQTRKDMALGSKENVKAITEDVSSYAVKMIKYSQHGTAKVQICLYMTDKSLMDGKIHISKNRLRSRLKRRTSEEHPRRIEFSGSGDKAVKVLNSVLRGRDNVEKVAELLYSAEKENLVVVKMHERVDRSRTQTELVFCYAFVDIDSVLSTEVKRKLEASEVM